VDAVPLVELRKAPELIKIAKFEVAPLDEIVKPLLLEPEPDTAIFIPYLKELVPVLELVITIPLVLALLLAPDKATFIPV
jgi:hypothetical protein